MYGIVYAITTGYNTRLGEAEETGDNAGNLLLSCHTLGAPITSQPRSQGRNSQYHFKSSGRRYYVCVTWEINVSSECHVGENWMMIVAFHSGLNSILSLIPTLCPSTFAGL